MLNVTNVEVAGFRTAIRGMRNPLKSWDKADSQAIISEAEISEEFCNHSMDNLFTAMKDANISFTDEEKDQIIEEIKNTVIKSQIPGYEDTDAAIYFIMGENDLNLAQRLIKSGNDHSKFMRQIYVGMDITAPLYW